MRCSNCGIEIDDDEVLCKECKKALKKSSSKRSVNELEELIEEQKNLNDLEQTKELDDLSSLVEEKMKENDNNDSFKEIEKENEVKTREERLLEKEEIKTREERFEEKKNEAEKKSPKKKLIIIFILAVIILITIIIILIFNKKTPEKEKKEVINYERVINSYGKSVEKIVENYKEQNNEIPNWTKVMELSNYDKYSVVCDIHSIYEDGSIYLNECKVNNKKTKYSYGEEKEEKKEGKKINIYKQEKDEDYTYIDTSGGKLVGSVTCISDTCKFINGYDKYVLIEENNEYYLYNYEKGVLEFGPFKMNSDNDHINHILETNHCVYGIYYTDSGVNNIYSLSAGKTFKNIKGDIASDLLDVTPSIMLKYNYVVLVNNGKNIFLNLKTGNISYSINGNIGKYIEDEKNKSVYMTVYDNNYNKFKLYNNNGKLLFNGKEFTNIYLYSEELLVSNENKFWIYDSKLNLELSSKDYEKILEIFSNFIVVIDNNHLKIVDTDDKILTTFEDEWTNNFYFNSSLSGLRTENNKKGIYLFVENKDIPEGTIGRNIEYYYILETKETGKIEK